MMLEYDDTYYFSFATERTSPTRDCFFFTCGEYYEKADALMLLPLQITGNIIGRESEPSKQKNDGLVNWENQLCPTNDEFDRSRCIEYDGENWPIGTWVYQDVSYLDHVQISVRDPITDALNYKQSAKKLYVDHAKRLKALPVV